jgi:hypothetical protein
MQSMELDGDVCPSSILSRLSPESSAADAGMMAINHTASATKVAILDRRRRNRNPVSWLLEIERCKE